MREKTLPLFKGNPRSGATSTPPHISAPLVGAIAQGPSGRAPVPGRYRARPPTRRVADGHRRVSYPRAAFRRTPTHAPAPLGGGPEPPTQAFLRSGVVRPHTPKTIFGPNRGGRFGPPSEPARVSPDGWDVFEGPGREVARPVAGNPPHPRAGPAPTGIKAGKKGGAVPAAPLGTPRYGTTPETPRFT